MLTAVNELLGARSKAVKAVGSHATSSAAVSQAAPRKRRKQTNSSKVESHSGVAKAAATPDEPAPTIEAATNKQSMSQDLHCASEGAAPTFGEASSTGILASARDASRFPGGSTDHAGDVVDLCLSDDEECIACGEATVRPRSSRRESLALFGDDDSNANVPTALSQLHGMGFPVDLAREALSDAGGDMHGALEVLVDMQDFR